MTTPDTPAPCVHILGTHGVPAAYGGFETAAQNVGLHLADKGWNVVVYCQIPGQGQVTVDEWRGLTRVLIPERRPGWLGTASFDLKSIKQVLRVRHDVDVCLTFGYNTGVFNLAQRAVRVPNVINMDGMEWTRARWGLVRQGVLLANERFAGLVGDILIADHPVIADYLRRHFGRRRVRTVTYGAHPVHQASPAPALALGLQPGRFATLICRPIPENSILEIVTAWSRRLRGYPLVVLGDYTEDETYQREVLHAASSEVRFVGAIYDEDILSSLRFHSRAYIHGHTVGGTNPSLVEALAAGNPVIAHRNPYNTWVAGQAGRYFTTADELATVLDELLADDLTLAAMSTAARSRFEQEFTWDRIGDQYEQALLEVMRGERSRVPRAQRAREGRAS